MKKTAIVTGASAGIGKAVALALALDCDRIAITSYRRQQELQEVGGQLRRSGVTCIVRSGDCGDFCFVQALVEEVVSAWGRVDLLVNNAGIASVGLLSCLSPEEWDRLLRTNLSSVFYFCREVVPHMVHEHSGRILNISSVWGEVGASCEAAYAATKGGVNALSQSLGKELAPSGIAVNALSCGAVHTSMNDCFSADELAALEETIPCGRMAAPEEVAAFARSILSAPAYLTGQIIRFDGGWI